jgi:hypothetical protein
VLLLPLAVLAASCGDSDSDDDTTSAGTDGGQAAATTEAAESTGGAAANACPPDGCTITIVDVTQSGEELEVTWEPNFTPDVDRNHIHIYWDIYTADQVSSDAADRGVEQGEWVPTADTPTYVTEGPVSVTTRGESTTLCVTAADGDHAVLDTSLVDCRDVADLL